MRAAVGLEGSGKDPEVLDEEVEAKERDFLVLRAEPSLPNVEAADTVTSLLLSMLGGEEVKHDSTAREPWASRLGGAAARAGL